MPAGQRQLSPFQYPDARREVCTIGYLSSGLHITALVGIGYMS